jgi:3-dehydroquinate synthase
MITVKSNIRDYTVSFPERADFLDSLVSLQNCVFIVDENVWKLHESGCLKSLPRNEVVVFPVSEDRKNLGSVEELYDRLMERSAKKNMTMVSIGGGILQDITGFAATTLYRGINWVFVPTTLLAQADSCIGSKTSLNYKRYKNLVGTFYPPSQVHIYAPFLTTLSEVDFFSGLGEVVKLHLMGGKQATRELIDALPRVMRRDPAALLAAVRNSLGIKQNYMAGDEFDTGKRNLLNYGHCFGHALETVCNYAIPHGQAVVIGMMFANIAAVKRGMLSAATADSLRDALLKNTLKARGTREDYNERLLLQAMQKDKKRVGAGLVMVMMKDDYSFEKVTDFSESELKNALNELTRTLGISA